MKLTNSSLAFLAVIVLISLNPSIARADKSPPDITLAGHGSRVLDLAFSPDAKWLATVGDDGLLKVWDLTGKKEVFSVNGTRNNANQVRFTPDGKIVLAIGSENNVVSFEADTGKPLPPIAMPDVPGGPAAMDLSPDGKTVAVVGRASLCLFDLPTGKLKGKYEIHPAHGVAAVAFSPDGTRIATAGSDNAASLVDASNGKVLQTFKLGLNGLAIAFSADGKKLIVSSTDRLVKSIAIADGEEKILVDKMMEVFTLQVSKNGKSLIVGGLGHGPSIVTLPDGNLSEAAYDSEDWVKAATISPDSKWLAGGGNGGAVYLWKMAN